MTTSGVYTVALSGRQLVRQSLLNIGAIDEDDDLHDNQYNDCLLLLNMMVAQWQGNTDFSPGLKVFLRRRGTMFLSVSDSQYRLSNSWDGWTADDVTTTTTTAATSGGTSVLYVSSITGMVAGYHIGIVQTDDSIFWSTIAAVGDGQPMSIASPLSVGVAANSQVYVYPTTAQMPVVVETATLRDINGDDTPLRILQLESYDSLPSKADPNYVGDPTAIYVEQQRTYTNVFTDVSIAQDTTKQIILTYLEPTQKFVNPADEPCYPEEWFLALCWGLSEQCTPMFKKIWTPKMEALKNSALAIAKQKTPHVSVMYFQPGAED